MKKTFARLAFTMTTLAASAFAWAAHAKEPTRSEDTRAIRAQALELESLGAERVSERFRVRNHKGEEISFRRRAPLPAPQWATLDPEKDGVEGTSTDRAYRRHALRIFLRSRGEPVVVAVIDGGVDLRHEDLKRKIWVNEKEQTGAPGVDDDGNGYVDDVHGWNFLGAKDGRNIDGNTLEVTRELVRLRKKKESAGLTPEEEKYLAEVTADYESQHAANLGNLATFRATLKNMENALAILRAAGLKNESAEAVRAIESSDPDVLAAKKLVLELLQNDLTSTYLREAVAYFENGEKFLFNTSFSSSDIVGDDPEKLDETGYGNSDVTGPDASHGTHVAGIIAARRGNLIGVKGQARRVLIMPIRAVPNGDERDKDVANAIRYAVDNGARIINMSFGKPYSPHKSAVDSACRYAESRGVLLVHAAGNAAKNTESNANYPSKRLLPFGSEPARALENWIEVGASGSARGPRLAAFFSNFGKTTVDLFAPGMNIVSTVPGNSYASFQGTSMASPEVAGVAALALSQKPELDAKTLRAVLLATVTKYEDLMVRQPTNAGTGELVPFSSLSVTGGIVNALRALNFVN